MKESLQIGLRQRVGFLVQAFQKMGFQKVEIECVCLFSGYGELWFRCSG